MEMIAFITSRQAAYDRLAELSKIEIKTEAENYEEQLLSRYFWETGALDERIRYGLLGFDPYAKGMTDIQRRIMYLARYQAA